LACGLIAVLAALSFDSRLIERLSVGLGDNFLSDRGFIWNCGWHAFLQSPWLGFGPDNFDPVSRGELGPIEGCAFSSDQAHNLMLNVLVDTGLVGAVAFVWLVVEIIRRLRAARSFEGRSFVVWASGVAVMFQVAVGGLVDNVVSNEPNYAFGLIVGLAIAEPTARWARGRASLTQGGAGP
jgi:O-antigen ligase